jgi:hypothetical protein
MLKTMFKNQYKYKHEVISGEYQLTNIEAKNSEIKKYNELLIQKNELIAKIDSLETKMIITKSAFNSDGNFNPTFIKLYRELLLSLQSMDESTPKGKEVSIEFKTIPALEKLKVELENVESQLAEFEIVDQANETQEQKPKVETLDSLFTTESGNRNIEFYDILYKRYAKEIKQGIEDNFTERNNDGSEVVLTETERMSSFMDI